MKRDVLKFLNGYRLKVCYGGFSWQITWDSFGRIHSLGGLTRGGCFCHDRKHLSFPKSAKTTFLFALLDISKNLEHLQATGRHLGLATDWRDHLPGEARSRPVKPMNECLNGFHRASFPFEEVDSMVVLGPIGVWAWNERQEPSLRKRLSNAQRDVHRGKPSSQWPHTGRTCPLPRPQGPRSRSTWSRLPYLLRATDSTNPWAVRETPGGTNIRAHWCPK